MQTLVADRIREALPDLPKAERRVARAILAAYPVAGLETVARLAARAKVSGPTIIRLVTRLGFEGFPAFQQALLGELDERATSPLLQYQQRTFAADVGVVPRSRQVLMDALDRSLSELDLRAFDRVVELLTDERRRVFTAGGRFTGLAAKSLAMHLEILRPGARHLEPTEWIAYAMDARRGDILVAFDVRRYQRTTVELGRRAARQGATVVLVTDPWLSPLAADAEVVLSVAVDAPSPFDSQISVHGLVETLVAAVVERMGRFPEDRLAAYDRLWEQQDFRYRDGEQREEVR
ncbi:MAG: MurR/RpiR family transcriptional regulator [Candidatus Limnocylindria bacterium]